MAKAAIAEGELEDDAKRRNGVFGQIASNEVDVFDRRAASVPDAFFVIVDPTSLPLITEAIRLVKSPCPQPTSRPTPCLPRR
jgi:hypothetical protein